jgi:hypothetical protein
MNEPTTTLAYSLVSEPENLAPASEGHPRQGRLEITAALDPSSTQVLRCRSITVTVPTGRAPDGLTNQPERITTGYRARTRWLISKNTANPTRTEFTLRPQNLRRELVFDAAETVTLILERIPLITQAGTVEIQITADTNSGTEPYARATTTVPLTIHRAAADQP